MKISIGFRELQLPSVFTDGSKNDWVGCDTVDMGLYYLLNDGSNMLAYLLDKLETKKFYFDTEVLCHEAMSSYYSQHNVSYPYISEWRNARAKMFGVQPETIESQVMRFK